MNRRERQPRESLAAALTDRRIADVILVIEQFHAVEFRCKTDILFLADEGSPC
jgi:hypothetical protein